MKQLLKQIMRRTAKTAATLSITYSALAALGSNVHYQNKEADSDLVMLISKPEESHEKIVMLLNEVYITRVEQAFGKPANVIYNAKIQDFTRIVEDQKYQNIVVAGHGSWVHWRTSESSIYEILDVTTPLGPGKNYFEIRDFDDMQKGIINPKQKKKGLFVRHTCGVDNTERQQLGTCLVESPEQVRGWNRETWPLDWIINPIPEPLVRSRQVAMIK